MSMKINTADTRGLPANPLFGGPGSNLPLYRETRYKRQKRNLDKTEMNHFE